jgi:aryl-alcohol dehydrogenase-like predicted oxidoreductase
MRLSTRPLGNSGLHITRVGLGSWAIARAERVTALAEDDWRRYVPGRGGSKRRRAEANRSCLAATCRAHCMYHP